MIIIIIIIIGTSQNENERKPKNKQILGYCERTKNKLTVEHGERSMRAW